MSTVSAWQAFGRRAAVVAGTSTALVCLLAHNSLLTASLRGGATLLAVLLIVRIASSMLARLPSGGRQ